MAADASIIEVSAAIIFDGALMLVSRRPPGSYFEGWWEWPGGKRQAGESAEQCARRELAEETGLLAGPLREFRIIEADYPGRHVRVTFFVGRLAPGVQAAANAHEHRWLKPVEVLRLQFLEPNLPVLHALITNPPAML
jgi:mutator protein MutT